MDGMKWHLDRFFSECFSFPLSLAFHQCSIFIVMQLPPVLYAVDSNRIVN
jgi:hypothetical protein